MAGNLVPLFGLFLLGRIGCTRYDSVQNLVANGVVMFHEFVQDIKAQSDEDLLVLPTDKILAEDPGFKVFCISLPVNYSSVPLSITNGMGTRSILNSRRVSMWIDCEGCSSV